MFLEEGDGPLPGELGRRLVVTRRRVVVKAVLGAGIEMRLVAGARRLQRRLEGRPHRVDALVDLRVLDQKRRLDARHARRLGRRAVERHTRVQIGAERDGEEVGRAAAPAEAGGAELAGGERVRLHVARAVEHVRAQLGLLQAGLQGAAVVVVAGIAADGREAVGRQRQEPLGGGAAGDILYIGIEPPVLVDHQDGGEGAGPGRLHQVAAHRAGGAAGRGPAHVARLDPRVGERDRLGERVPGQQRVRHGQAADRDHAGPLEKLAAVDAPVAVLVVEVVDAPVDLALRDHEVSCPGFQNPCEGMRNARLKRDEAFSHAMIIVSSAMVSSS